MKFKKNDIIRVRKLYGEDNEVTSINVGDIGLVVKTDSSCAVRVVFQGDFCRLKGNANYCGEDNSYAMLLNQIEKVTDENFFYDEDSKTICKRIDGNLSVGTRVVIVNKFVPGMNPEGGNEWMVRKNYDY